jgi:hypothetical protein
VISHEALDFLTVFREWRNVPCINHLYGLFNGSHSSRNWSQEPLATFALVFFDHQPYRRALYIIGASMRPRLDQPRARALSGAQSWDAAPHVYGSANLGEAPALGDINVREVPAIPFHF